MCLAEAGRIEAAESLFVRLAKSVEVAADAEAQLEADIPPDPDLKLITLLERANSKIEERFATQPNVRAAVQATLARAFLSVSQPEEAARLWEKVVAYHDVIMRSEDPDNLLAMNNLALAYRDLARYDAARELLTRVVEVRRRVTGPESHETLVAINNLATCHTAQGRYDEAEKLLESIATTSERVNGPTHPDTLLYLNNCLLYTSPSPRD